jgi:hypothetical protein
LAQRAAHLRHLNELQRVGPHDRLARHQFPPATTTGSATSLWLLEIAPSAFVAVLPPPPLVKYRRPSDHLLGRTAESQLHAAGPAHHFSAPALRDTTRQQHSPHDREMHNLLECTPSELRSRSAVSLALLFQFGPALASDFIQGSLGGRDQPAPYASGTHDRPWLNPRPHGTFTPPACCN